MAKYINIKGKLYDLSVPKVMAILNFTPDSFYEKSRFRPDNQVLKSQIEEIVLNGAEILDIGGYSTRPGATSVSVEEEIIRTIPIIEFIKSNFPEIIVSIDTFRGEVAQKAVENGADIINDVSGGLFDKKMLTTVAVLNVPYILMHNRGNVETMHHKSEYQNVVLDVIKELQIQVLKLKNLGVRDIIIDPGFGFSKNVAQNFEILANLEKFEILDCPILAGLSRKSMIWRTLNTTADFALNGTTALNMIALQKGANVLRVHDAKEATECVQLFEKTKPYFE